MRKLIGFVAMVALAPATFAQSGRQMVNDFANSLNSAKSLTTTYTSQVIGGVPNNYSVSLSKPNLARIDTPWQTIVADGANITTYQKADKSYYKVPQTRDGLIALFNDDSLSIWKSFFDQGALSNVGEAKALGHKNRNGMDLAKVQVTMDAGGHVIDTFYLDKDNLARMTEISVPKQDTTLLLTTDTLSVGDPITAEKLAFKAPDGSHEISMDEVNSGKWFDDLDKAFQAAKATHKLVLLEFSATWCHPCQMLAQEVFSTDQFRQQSRYFVFCHIDVDQNPALSAQYHADAIPKIVFMKSDGTTVHETIGYGGPDQFYSELNAAKSAGGI